MRKVFEGLTLPVKCEYGAIRDAAGKVIIRAERNTLESSLRPVGMDAMMYLVADLINDAFQYDKVDQILKKHGY